MGDPIDSLTTALSFGEPVSATVYADRHGVSVRYVVSLIEGGRLAGVQRDGVWYVEGAPPDPPPEPDPPWRPSYEGRARIDVLEDTADRLRLRFRPRPGWAALSWAFFALVFLLVVVPLTRQGPDGVLFIAVGWAFVLGSQLLWWALGWDDLTLSAEGLVLRHRIVVTWRRRTLSLDDVVAFERRYPVGRGDTHCIAVVTTTGRRVPFGPNVDPKPMIAVLNGRLDELRRAWPLLP